MFKTIEMSVKANMILATLSKAGALLTSFFMIPILLKSLGSETYGVWVTISSLASWLILFDFGLGNSFKNTVASSDQATSIKQYSLIFSAYVFIGGTLTLFFLSFLVIFRDKIENIDSLTYLYLPLFILFPLSLYSFALQGFRLVGVNSFLETLKILLFALLYVVHVQYFGYVELNTISLMFVSSILIPQFIQIIIFRAKSGIKLLPPLMSLKNIFLEDGFKIGIKFFIIQLSSLISFSLGNILIYDSFSAMDVAVYDITNKIFIAALSVFNMVIAVVWPEITTAYSKGNFLKCRMLYKMLLIIASIFSFLLLIVVFKFEFILQLLGVNQVITLNNSLLFSVFILTCMQAFAYCGAVVLNAINKLNIQICLAILSIIFIVPLYLFLVYLDVGMSAYPISTAFMVFIAVFLYNYKALKLLKDNN